MLGPVSRAFTQILLLVITHTAPQLCVVQRRCYCIQTSLPIAPPQFRFLSPGVRHAAPGLRVAVRGWELALF